MFGLKGKGISGKYLLLGFVVWTLFVAGSLSWNLRINSAQTKELALKEARAIFNKDATFRFWGAAHGGIYVPKTKKTPANAFLDHVPERDIKTPSGKELTLMSPAYMLREMMEVYEKEYGIKGHITSDNYFRPETAPDGWEKKALEKFKKGEKEVVEFTDYKDAPYLRMMSPLYTKKSCRKCHPSYKVGDLRGGVSLSLPMKEYFASERKGDITILATHVVMLLLGYLTIFFFGRKFFFYVDNEIKNKQHLRHLIDSQPNIVVINDGKRLIDTNREFFRFFSQYKDIHSFHKEHDCICEFFEEYNEEGYLKEQMGDKTWLEVLKENPGGNYRVMIKQGPVPNHFLVKFEHFNVNGGEQNIITFTDITQLEKMRKSLEKRVEAEVEENKNRQEQLLQQATYAQMGEMVTMISHHWRQPLNVIGLLMQNLLDSFKYDELDEKGLEEASSKIMEILKDLSQSLNDLSIYITKQTDRHNFNIVGATEKLYKLTKSEMTTNFVEYRFENRCGEDFYVYGVPSYYGQVLNNIIHNAKEAVLDNEQNDRFVSVELDCENGENLTISIEDNGGGIKQGAMHRLFEPFYTTKGIINKTGLGLYIVKVIVEQQFGGTIDVFNTKGGALFRITLPITKEEDKS